MVALCAVTVNCGHSVPFTVCCLQCAVHSQCAHTYCVQSYCEMSATLYTLQCLTIVCECGIHETSVGMQIMM